MWLTERDSAARTSRPPVQLSRWSEHLVFAAAAVFVLFVQGCIPFLTVPTLGQAVWASGFALSLASQSVTDLHALSIGIPEPAAISFGLAAVYPQSLLIRLGMHPVDAYTIIFAFWFLIAFWGALRLAERAPLSKVTAILCAVLWMCLPIIWGHARYSMLSLGLALLPFYVYCALNLLDQEDTTTVDRAKALLLYLSSTLIAVFMDGYSFMMFAVASTAIFLYTLLIFPARRGKLSKSFLPAHCLFFALSYFLYSLYIGKASFSSSSVDFIRAYGVDLDYLVVPTAGVHWLWDLIGWNAVRNPAELYGDISVWTTTFSLPLLAAGIFAGWRARKSSKYFTVYALLALFGFYMALGPSLKINSSKPIHIQTNEMPRSAAPILTGSGILSRKLPGFSNMRAAYRWTALGSLGLWLMVALLISYYVTRRQENSSILGLSFLIIAVLPNLYEKQALRYAYREMFLSMEAEIAGDLMGVVEPGERVVFLPYRNDFLANYIAPHLSFYSYNIGGDKNLASASEKWPEYIRGSKPGRFDRYFSARVLMLLEADEADVVLIPHIDLLWAAHLWPAPLLYLPQAKFSSVDLYRTGFVTVQNQRLFTAIRLRHLPNAETRDRAIRESYCAPPGCLDWDGLSDIYSQVGRRTEYGIETDGSAGYLLFGPYEMMRSGDYRLKMTGYAEGDTQSFRVDVVGRDVTRPYAEFTGPSNMSSVNGELIIDETVTLPADDVIEIRVFVDAETDLRLAAYRFEAIKSD